MPVDVHEQERVSGNEKLDGECSKLLQRPPAAGQALLEKCFALIRYLY